MPDGTTPESQEVLREWWDAFEANAKRSLETRMRYAFIRTYRPVLDDAPTTGQPALDTVALKAYIATTAHLNR